MNALLRPAVSLFLMLSLLTGIVYPLVVTAIGQVLFTHAANGSILTREGVPVGSALIGQQFTSPGYFWGRPSATGPYAYNGAVSSGSNLGPLNPALSEAVKARIEALRAADPGNTRPVPIDLVTASASGLDPDISLAAAQFQVSRVARLRDMPSALLDELIERLAQRPWFGIFGEPRVNVLQLNLALDDAKRLP
jgi:potassium-transporting ATPase KdpC subunit